LWVILPHNPHHQLTTFVPADGCLQKNPMGDNRVQLFEDLIDENCRWWDMEADYAQPFVDVCCSVQIKRYELL
jgi:hypothetical protein